MPLAAPGGRGHQPGGAHWGAAGPAPHHVGGLLVQLHSHRLRVYNIGSSDTRPLRSYIEEMYALCGYRGDNPIDIYKYAGKESVIKECEDSLRRLGTDYIDLYQIHWPDATTPLSETFEAVERLIEQGKVRYAGVCNYDAALLEDAAKLIDLVSDQIPYSMVNRGMDRDIIPYCIRNEKSVIAYSPLERGLLTGKMQPGYRFAEGDHRKENPFFTDESIKRTNAFLEKLQPLADEKKATLGQLVIRWTIEHPGITVALVGARNPEQAIQNAKAADIILTPEELQFINQQIDQMLK